MVVSAGRPPPHFSPERQGEHSGGPTELVRGQSRVAGGLPPAAGPPRRKRGGRAAAGLSDPSAWDFCKAVQILQPAPLGLRGARRGGKGRTADWLAGREHGARPNTGDVFGPNPDPHVRRGSVTVAHTMTLPQWRVCWPSGERCGRLGSRPRARNQAELLLR